MLRSQLTPPTHVCALGKTETPIKLVAPLATASGAAWIGSSWRIDVDQPALFEDPTHVLIRSEGAMQREIRLASRASGVTRGGMSGERSSIVTVPQE
jgi:hypothetical protein